MAKVDYAALASQLLNNIGGEKNISSMTHCATRMRFVLKDESKASTEAVKALDGVVTVVQAGGQYQVVISNSCFTFYLVNLIIENESANNLRLYLAEKMYLFCLVRKTSLLYLFLSLL